MITEQEYEQATKRIEEIIRARSEDFEFRELIKLIDQVEEYEDKYHPVDKISLDNEEE